MHFRYCYDVQLCRHFLHVMVTATEHFPQQYFKHLLRSSNVLLFLHSTWHLLSNILPFLTRSWRVTYMFLFSSFTTTKYNLSTIHKINLMLLSFLLRTFLWRIDAFTAKFNIFQKTLWGHRRHGAEIYLAFCMICDDDTIIILLYYMFQLLFLVGACLCEIQLHWHA